MKLIIAGSRTLRVKPELIVALCELFNININCIGSEIVCGGAGGIDASGEAFYRWYSLSPSSFLTFKKFPADWGLYGKAAGPIRNEQMAEYADALLLIWDGASRGSASMKKEMEALGKPVYEVIFKSNLPVRCYGSDSLV